MMKKQSIFKKTWLVSVVTILLTILVFMSVFVMFTRSFITKSQTSTLNQVADEITTILNQDDINTEKFYDYMLQGYQVCTVEGSDFRFTNLPMCIRDEFKSEISLMPSAGVVERDNVQVVSRKIYKDGLTSLIQISYPVTLRDHDIKALFKTVIPYLLIIGVGMAGLVSYFFAKHNAKKIENMNVMLAEMSLNEYPLIHEVRDGDELQDLENNINAMYLKLNMMMESLENEMDVVKRLEEDRQLFMRGAVHELKTPIMIISTMLEDLMVKEEVTGIDLQDIYQKIYKLDSLVKEILEVSKLSSIKEVDEVKVSPVILELLETYEYLLADKQITVEKELNDLVSIKIPEHSLLKIVSNLLSNAVKYSKDNSVISIVLTDTYFSIKNQTINSEIYAEEDLIKPFVSFEESQDYIDSSGLGLYIITSILNHYYYDYEINQTESDFEFIIRF